MLLGNYSVLNRNPLRYLGGSLVSPETQLQPNFNRGGARKNRQYVSMTTTGDKRFSLPYGSYPPVMTLLPQVGGDLSARQSGDFSITGTASGGLGLPGTGAASFVISIADAAGQLISSGAGTASFTIDTLPLLLTASLAGVGSTTFTLATNSPLLGAEANVIGDTTFAITGVMTPYATGNMTGSTVDTSTIVNANIVSVNGYSVTGNGQTGTEWGPL